MDHEFIELQVRVPSESCGDRRRQELDERGRWIILLDLQLLIAALEGLANATVGMNRRMEYDCVDGPGLATRWQRPLLRRQFVEQSDEFALLRFDQGNRRRLRFYPCPTPADVLNIVQED